MVNRLQEKKASDGEKKNILPQTFFSLDFFISSVSCEMFLKLVTLVLIASSVEARPQDLDGDGLLDRTPKCDEKKFQVIN